MMNSPLKALREALVGLTSIKNGSGSHRTRNHRRTLSYESLESRDLLAVVTLSNMSVSEDTADKPQSKVWEHAGQWWSVMPKSDGTWVWRLDGTSWTPTFRLTETDKFHADVKSTGGVAHVLLFDSDASQLASIEYVGGSTGYQMWSQRPQLVDLALHGSSETATIDIDSVGRMWVAYDTSGTVEVRYSDGAYSTWSDPIAIGSLGSDDISAIITMPNGSVGVLWSNQSADRFGFRVHQDGADANIWSENEVPASQSALNVGGGMADDHLNVKVASDGTVYAAVKTSYDSSGRARMALLVRRPNGVWDNMYTVDTGSSTRPIVVLNEAANRLIVAFTTSESGGNIVYRESPMDVISFGSRQTMISGTVNNVTSTKQNFTNNVVLLAAGGSSVRGALFSFDTITLNQAPIVDAGPSRSIDFGGTASLDGTVSDDGRPTPVNLVTTWSKFSGAGNVSFGSASSIDTTATFTQAGTYVLRLTANDGQRTSFDDMTVIVAEPTAPIGDTDPPPPPPSGPVEIAFQDGLFPAMTYAGTRDTYISGKSAGTNYGTANTLLIDGSPDLAALLKWDVSMIPTGSTVTSAVIELNVTDTSSGTYEVYALQRAWDELSANWQRYVTGQNWSTAGANNTSDRGSSVLGTISPTSTGTYRIVLNAAGIAAVQSWINNPASNFGVILQDYGISSGADFSSSEASTATQRPKLIIGYNPPSGEPPTNARPNVDAGPNRTISVGQNASLDGTVSDDNLPAPANLTSTWSKFSGPGNVSFDNANAIDTTASFTQAGTYVLRLTASDGDLSHFDEMTVIVEEVSTTVNLAPNVDAGPNRTITFGENSSLDGTVSDDNLPAPPNLTTSWSKFSGPGNVSFDSANSIDTTASFTQAGPYVLRLTANDGEFSRFDDMTVIVEEPADPPSGPVDIAFQDGLFPSLSYAGTRDTYISGKSTGSNYGTATALLIDGSPDLATLLKWDVSAIPAGSIVNSAAIELSVTNTTSGTYEAYALQRAWDELSATWQRYAVNQNWATAGASNTADRNATVLGSVSPRSNGTYRITLNAAGIAAVQAWINDPSANHGVLIQDYGVSSGADFLSSETANAAQRPKLLINYQPPALLAALSTFGSENQAPIVEAGLNRTVVFGNLLTLQGTVSDDGVPFSPGTVTYQWSKVSGPGVVTITNVTSLNTTVQFSTLGSYVLRLTAFDGELVAFDELTIDVVPLI